MSTYFGTYERDVLLWNEAKSWEGTPFHVRAKLKGHGVDCVHLVAEIYAACGVIEEGYKFPKYTLDGGQHTDRSILLEYVDGTGRFAEIGLETALPSMGCKGCGETPQAASLSALLPGDLLAFRPDLKAKVAHHAGIYLGGTDAHFIHAILKRGCVVNALRDSTWLERLVAIRRPMA
jgi:cell wall-associated NlpC family hydrolase